MSKILISGEAEFFFIGGIIYLEIAKSITSECYLTLSILFVRFGRNNLNKTEN